MKVLYISYDGMTDPLGQSQVLPYLVGLSRLGYQITLVSAEKPERYPAGKAIIEQICTEAGIDWQPVLYSRRYPVISAIKNSKSISAKAFELHKAKQFDLVHCRSYISAMIGLDLKRKYGLKFVFDMRGFWPDERVDGKVWNLKNPVFYAVYKYFKRKEKEFLNAADHTITLTENACDLIHEWSFLNHQPIPITVIPCCADLDLFSYHTISKAQREQCRQDLNIAPDDLVLCYLGSIGTWYMPTEMLQLFKTILQQNPKAKFFFITPDDPAHIQALAREQGIAAEHLVIRSAKRAEVPLYLAAADLGVFFIMPAYSKRASSPTKHGEMMGMGLPLICNAGVGDMDRIMQRTQSGFVLETFSAETYTAAANAIPSLLQLDKQIIREGGEAVYSLEKGIAKFAAVYKEVLSKPK